MTTDKTPSDALAQLRHLYANLTNGGVRDTASAKRIAEGLLSPAIAALERWGSPVVAGEPKRVFIVATGEEHEGEATYTRYDDSPPPLCDSECLYTTPQPTQAQAGAVPPIEWPKASDVGRIGDMSPSAHIRVGLDSDNDVFVSVWDEHGGGSIEFCNPGGGGGGQSSRTRMALLALMVAMEADNAEKPSRDWWAQRMGGIKEGGQHADQ